MLGVRIIAETSNMRVDIMFLFDSLIEKAAEEATIIRDNRQVNLHLYLSL